MATSDNMNGESMIVQRIPMVHGKSVGCDVYIPGPEPRRPCSLNLTHSISLPERENLPNGDLQGRASKSSADERAGISDPGSGNARGYNSTILRCRNLFVLESEVNGTEENCDTYANNMRKYCKEYSFCQHGNSDGTQDKTLRYATNPWSLCCSQCIESTTACNHNIKIVERFWTVRDDRQVLSDSGLQLRRDDEGTPILMDCEEQDWADEKDCDGYVEKEGTFEEHDCYDYVPNIANALSDCEAWNQNQTDYISDSSCNSSDGVLVNFSAIYNKTNNAVPATPYDLDSPAKQSRGSGSMHQDDDFKLIPCWSPCGVDPNCNIYQADCDGFSSQGISDLTPCQGQLTTYTNNYYKLVNCDLSTQSSPAWSSLTSWSEAHSHGSMTPPTEYFLFGKPETEDVEVVEVDQRDLQVDEDAELKRSKRTRKISKGIDERKIHKKTHHDECKDPEPNSYEHTSATRGSQSWNNKPCFSLPKQEALRHVLSCPGQISGTSHVLRQHKTSFAELARYKKSERSPSVVKNSKEDSTCSWFSQNVSPAQRKAPSGQNVTLITSKTEKESGRSGSSETAGIPPMGVPESCQEVVYDTKPQRPTSLPIQPFVLQPPSGKQSSKALGSLMNHYMSNKHGASKSTDRPSCLNLSSLDYSSIHLEVASCSDTCSTCTPTPIEPHIRLPWAPPSPLFFQAHPDLKYRSTKIVEPTLPDKIPRANHTCLDQTCQTLKPCVTGHEKTSLKSIPSRHLQNFLLEQADSHQTSPKCLAPEPRTQEVHVFPHSSLSPAITSVTSLTSDTSLILPGAGRCNSDAVHQANINEELDTAVFHIFGATKLPCFLVKEHHQHGDSSSLADRPPEEFCSSPDACTKFLPIDLLQRKDLLKSLSVAVDLITAHFSSCADTDEKFRLGNSSLCPRISQLVLDQLCPAFRSILQDGLRPFKPDLIVGRRSNKPWSVVEASTQPGPSTRMLHSLVSVVKKCSKLTNHSVRLNAFFLGLLNLSALESWFWHLHTCVDVIAEYYHPWAFLALSQDPACKSLFQELLLLLQPLSELPFDLHLLSESRLQRRREQTRPSVQQSRFLALSGCSFLKTPNRQNSEGQPERSKLKEKREPCAPSQTEIRTSCSANIHEILQDCAVTVSKHSTREPEQKSVCSKKRQAGWWLNQTPIPERLMEADCAYTVPHIRNHETLVGNEDRRREEFSIRTDEVKPPKELRWARLFGSGIGSPVPVEKAQRSIKQNQRIRPPSEWLQLGASKMDQLAQSVWSNEMSRTVCRLQQRPKLKQ